MSDPTITFVCTACLDKEKRIAILQRTNELMMACFSQFYDELLNNEFFKPIMTDDIKSYVLEAKSFMNVETFIAKAQEEK